MQINGKHISTFGATLLDRNISSNRVSYNAKWDYMMDMPSFYGNTLEFKDVLLYFLVKADTEETFIKNMGLMCEEFRKGGVVRFDDIKLNYTMYLKQKPEYTKLNEDTYRLDFVLDSDYGLSDLKSVSGSKIVEVNNNGSYPTPAIVNITLPVAQSEFTIQGFERALVFKDLPNSTKIYVNTYDGTIQVNGVNGVTKLKSFHLPKLPVGYSQIVASANCSIQVNYYERY